MIDTEKIRQDFPALQQERNGKPLIYFDNACMTLKPTQVITAMNRYYYNFPACGGHGRSAHWFAKRVNWEVYGIEEPAEVEIEGAREKIRRLINAKHREEIVFTRNTTESINLVAKSFPFREGVVILTTDQEHNSNLCPWKELEKKGIAKHLWVPSNDDNTFNLERFEKMLKKNDVQLVSMFHTSNLDGYTIPADEVIKLSHKYGIKVLLDAAQSVPHKVIDVQKLDVDFLAFSVHKMCGPTGIGILYGKNDLLNDKNFGPFLVGGDTVEDTFLDKPPKYLSSPYKFEAGLQNYAGIIGAGIAADYLLGIGLENISKHECELNKFLMENLSNYQDEFDIIGPEDPVLRSGIITLCFKRRGVPSLTKERFLKEVGHLWDITYSNEYLEEAEITGIDAILNGWNNIMVRSGEFCVHSWFHKKSISRERQTIRVSLYVYNTKEECNLFVETLKKIIRLPEYTMLPKV